MSPLLFAQAASQVEQVGEASPAQGFRLWQWLGRVAFENWPGNVFQRSTWEDLMYGFWVALALGSALLLVGELVARRAGFPPSARTTQRAAVVLTVIGFFAYFSGFNPSVRYKDYYHRHEFFHYYLGSKYSKELGYTKLYECVAAAEIELGRRAQLEKQELRDLGAENLIKPIKNTAVFENPELCTSRFAPERWVQFKTDVEWMESTARGTYWENMKKDHGYNPPPVWTTTGKLFTSLGPASDTSFKLLASIDVFLHLAILALMRWAFGWRIAAVTAVFWGCNAAANFYWTGGAFLRQDWIFFFIASMCLAKKRYFGLSGAAFVWSGLLRAFPFAAGFGWAVLIGLHWIRHRRLHPDHRRFIAGAAVAGVVLVPVSLAVAGPQSYKEFVTHIALHNNTPLTNHMGLQTLLVHTWDGRMRFARDESLDDSFAGWKQGRVERKQAMRPLQGLIVFGLAAWTVWALHRTRHFWLGLPLSLPLLTSLTNITCYYFVMFIAFASLVRLRPALGPALLATAAASQILLAHFYYIDDRFTALSALYFAFALLPLVAFSRPLSKQALGAWFARLKARPSATTERPSATTERQNVTPPVEGGAPASQS